MTQSTTGKDCGLIHPSLRVSYAILPWRRVSAIQSRPIRDGRARSDRTFVSNRYATRVIDREIDGRDLMKPCAIGTDGSKMYGTDRILCKRWVCPITTVDSPIYGRCTVFLFSQYRATADGQGGGAITGKLPGTPGRLYV
jgi:hypothetical protein